MNDKPKVIEVNGNCDWLQDFSNVDFDRIEECDYDEAAETFTEKLHEFLAEHGFETVAAEGRGTTCEEWSANTFVTLIGPCGSFDEFGPGSVGKVYEAIGKAQAAMEAEWAAELE